MKRSVREKRSTGKGRSLVVRLLAVLGLLLSPFLLATAQADTHGCVIANVAFFSKPLGSRMHVQCQSAAPGGIAYFVYNTKNKEAPMVMNLLTTALAGNKTLTIVYNPADLSGAKIGCLNSDCRLIQGVAATN